MSGGERKGRGLTPKQARFIEEYLVDLNATQAAIRAGYSAKTAEWIGPQLLTKTHVAEAIAARRAVVSAEAQRRTVDVLADIGRVRAHCMELVPAEGNGMTMRAPKEALKALELEGKHLGAFTDKVQLSNPDGSLRPAVVRIVGKKAGPAHE